MKKKQSEIKRFICQACHSWQVFFTLYKTDMLKKMRTGLLHLFVWMVRFHKIIENL